MEGRGKEVKKKERGSKGQIEGKGEREQWYTIIKNYYYYFRCRW